MERVTITIDGETLTAIRGLVGLRGVSAFLRAAALERLARLGMLRLLDELDARHGKPSASVRRAIASDARRIFARKI